MSNVATASQLPMPNNLHYGGVSSGGVSNTKLKRKTPSELRGELLKKKNLLDCSDEPPSKTGAMRNADGAVSGNKSDSLKAARFRRMDEHFPVTKTSRVFCRKEILKEYIHSKCVSNIKSSSLTLDSNDKHGLQKSCLEGTVASEGDNDTSRQINNNSCENSTANAFKSVRELSLRGGMIHNSSSVDMGKALKGLVSCKPHGSSAPLAQPMHRSGNIAQQRLSEIHIPGQKSPLDLTLKTSMRVLSASSVNWFYRLSTCATLNDMGLFSHEDFQGQSMTSAHPICTSQIARHAVFHSWVHPQSSLPHVVISALTSAVGGQLDFLSKRQQAWEDSFRSLYYMLRKKLCKIFYVCTVHFVAMFTISDGPNKTKHSCYAYVSQSTRNLRSLLKEHDASFSMPLCHSKVEEVTAEDLVALSEIERNNLGKTRAVESLTGVDNTPQSLLMFAGKNVHGLYDFLLNYRSLYSPLIGSDVPVLYSPVPFENAALSAPEIRCKQVRRVEHMSSQLKDSNMYSEPIRSSSSGICYSIELRDAYIPPWVVSGVCDAMCSNGGNFQASFVTESTSIGLNVGLDSTNQPPQQVEAEIPMEEQDLSFGIPNTTLSLLRHSAFLKGLKYGDTSYTAFLSPID
ncbi:protein downstream neighbor of Son-like [Salvia splendens]|uniref:protein downstream neighbor of Son-like n=1 Tax=Salvia splendens TaxID=180675 RepID=UPI001C25F43C|nr:protein downstream neighbor of Son-like [Salvia splendens]XP_042053504.1 protein downstream neighbor of Son-like [Salvia splendens]XP_042053513.1 protein downstream neighbor of Son-like [Salvia splendens]XP_042053522.1 protein downstream neighbor of Son-like [Salvia splendens]